MKNKLIAGLLVITMSAIAVLGYLYKTEKDKNIDLSINNAKYQRDLAFNDSINNILTNVNADLDSANKVYQIENANIKWELERVEEENDSLLNVLSNMPDDSIGQRIVDIFGGKEYRILQIDDSTFIAYKVITSVNILKQDIAFKALFKRFELLSRQMDSKDTLMKKQAKNVLILTNTNYELLTKNKLLITDVKDYQDKIVELTTEVDKQKGLKRIGFYTAGGLLLLLIIL